jgi:hypothetical protein
VHDITGDIDGLTRDIGLDDVLPAPEEPARWRAPRILEYPA